MKKIWLNRVDTFEAAEKFDESYYLSMGRIGRLETMQFLREIYPKINDDGKNESRKRLRRVAKIIQ